MARGSYARWEKEATGYDPVSSLRMEHSGSCVCVHVCVCVCVCMCVERERSDSYCTMYISFTHKNTKCYIILGR